MKRNSVFRKVSAAVLAAVMLLSLAPSAFAAVVPVIDEEQKLQYLYTFNDAVNSIKEDKPSFKYVRTSGMNKEDDIFVGSKSASDLSDEAYKYLSVLVDAFFNPDKGLVNNFIAVLTESYSDVKEKEVAKGVDTTNFLPLYGESYMSALTVDDEYTLLAESRKDILAPENDKLTLRFKFDEYDLENVEDSPLGKVFDLPSGSINPVIIGGNNFSDSEGPLSEVQFDNFKYHNAYVQAEFNSNGELTKYTQNISYTLSISFYDMMRIFGAYTDIDLMEIGLAIANPILSNTGKPEVTARDILKDSVIYIQYDVKIELYDFDWNPRYFGDIDNDGEVDAYDARTALRNSVGLEEIKKQEALIYADVDFDGSITAADSRAILRMSVGLDEMFNKVPDGETIKIVVITPPVTDEPDEPENSDEPEEPEEPDEPENPDEGENPDENEGGNIQLPSTGEVAEGVSEFVDSIFDIINAFKGEGVAGESIAQIIQQVKDIIAAGKADPEPDGGFVPYESENA